MLHTVTTNRLKRFFWDMGIWSRKYYSRNHMIPLNMGIISRGYRTNCAFFMPPTLTILSPSRIFLKEIFSMFSHSGKTKFLRFCFTSSLPGNLRRLSALEIFSFNLLVVKLLQSTLDQTQKMGSKRFNADLKQTWLICTISL